MKLKFDLKKVGPWLLGSTSLLLSFVAGKKMGRTSARKEPDKTREQSGILPKIGDGAID